MELLIVGAGGVGGCLAANLAAAGHSVTVVARGEHLRAIRERGLTLRRSWAPDLPPQRVAACEAQEYRGAPDAALVCVKGYALEGVEPLLERLGGRTLLLPLLNGVGVGDRLGERMPGALVLDGCFYGSAHLSGPGEVSHDGKLLRVIFGRRDGDGPADRLLELKEAFEGAGISAVLSDNIRRDCFRKFLLISPWAAAGARYGVDAAGFHRPGPPREAFCDLVRELLAMADRLGYRFPVDMLEDGLRRLDAMGPGLTTSLQKDLARGGPSELDAQVFEPVRLAKRLGTAAPRYAGIARHFGFQG